MKGKSTTAVCCIFAATVSLLPFTSIAQTPEAPRTFELSALTDDILLLRIDEGYVVHHGEGQRPDEDVIYVDPLDGAAASSASAYTIASTDDPAYATPQAPSAVNRKSKPTEFAAFCDRFIPDPDPNFDNTCINDRPDQATEHNLYLRLPSPLRSGDSYTVTPSLPGVPAQTFTYDERTNRSEAVHANQVGYVPTAGEKFGYVYHWLGDGAGLLVDPLPENGGPETPRTFRLVNEATGEDAFTGTVAFRKPLDNQELAAKGQAAPFGNMLQAPSWECDFSSFSTEGEYRLCVDGVGCSFPFAVAEDVYLEPFTALVEGMYQQRSGIATTAPYTSQPRPAPHRVGVTPGFAGRLKYSTVRAIDYENVDNPRGQFEEIDAAILGPLEAWGWYQDAGDWDSYYLHTNVSAHLLWLYETTASKWADGQLSLPEQGNGLPDVLDEALWNLRFQQRLRAELIAKGYGTGGVGGGRVFGDLYGGDSSPEGTLRGSWEDIDRDWIVSGEDPMITYKYAGLAAHVAVLLDRYGLTDPEGVDWAAEAVSAYDWAEQNTLPADNTLSFGLTPFVHARFFGAANLYRLTGEERYETVTSADFDVVAAADVTLERSFGLAAYRAAAFERPESAPATVEKVTARLVQDGRDYLVSFRDSRAARWGGLYFFPIVVGQSSSPQVQPGILLHYFASRLDPENEAAYAAALYSTADYFLGNNPLNYVWITGVGEQGPSEILALDAWVLGGETPRPGMVPYGPVAQVFKFAPVNGVFNFAWPLQYIYPANENEWPAHELWFDQRQAPTTAEYTVHQTLSSAYLTYGYLYALTAPDVTDPLPVTFVSASAVRSGEVATQVEVEWTTATEVDNAGFTVERSGDASAWTSIAEVPAAGPSDYAWTDFAAPLEETYYRIRQTDLDGQSTTTQTLAVPAAGMVSEVWTLEPSATRDVARVVGEAEGPVEVFDASGRRVIAYPTGTTELSLAGLPIGIYYVRADGVTREVRRVR